MICGVNKINKCIIHLYKALTKRYLEVKKMKQNNFIKNLLYSKRKSNKIAVIDDDVSYTYEQIYCEVVENIGLMNEIATSSNVGMFIDNSIDYVIGYFAISFLNKTIVPFETQIKKDRLCGVVQYCDTHMIITNDKNYNFLLSCLKDGLDFDLVIYNINSKTMHKLLSRQSRIKKNEKNKLKECRNIAIMLHTSGTTSAPKRVMLTYENLHANVLAHIDSLKLTSDDRSLISLPMYFGYCNTSQFLTHFYLGGSIVFFKDLFHPLKFIKFLNKYQCTNTTCIPSMLYLIANKFEGTVQYIKSVRYICFGGGGTSSDILDKLLNIFPEVGFVHTYGQTEAGPRISCLLPEDFMRKRGSVGKPLKDIQIKVVDLVGKELPIEKVGEIVVKSEGVMEGYYKRLDETRRVIRNGWLYTGDLGMVDSEGYIYIKGRKKNVIITGGKNIYPEHIEEILKEYEFVREAIVVGEENALLGEVPVALVVLEPKSNIDSSEILSFCKDKLESDEIPFRIDIVDELEKTNTGKIRRIY